MFTRINMLTVALVFDLLGAVSMVNCTLDCLFSGKCGFYLATFRVGTA